MNKKRNRRGPGAVRPARVPQTPSALYPARVNRSAKISDLGRFLGRKVSVAGRVMAIDRAEFTLTDQSGSVRVQTAKPPALFSLVEAEGVVEAATETAGGSGRPDTSVGIRAAAVRLLAPAVREPAGEKHWERLLLAPAQWEMAAVRARIIAEVRRFFAKKQFLEVDTPALVAVPGMEPHLHPFATELRAAGGGRGVAHLITSPEYSLKKLLAAGGERIFEIARVFRNGESLGGLHQPEFLMLEWYRAYASYLEIMDDVEELLAYLARTVLGRPTVRLRGITVDLASPWERLSVAEAFQKYAAVDLEKNLAPEPLRRALRAKGYRPTDSERYDDLFFRVFLNEIEPCLGRRTPTILYDYPVALAALAKRSAADPRWAERFEVYVAGLELANAFSELNDPSEQEARLLSERALRKKLGRPLFGPDRDFLDALKTGMPPAGGIALGLDRLIMILLQKERIEEVRLFPAGEMFNFEKKTTVFRT